MDRGRLMYPWKINFAPHLLIFMLLLLVSQFLVSQGETTCAEDEHLHSSDAFCCNKCPPGFRMANECNSTWSRTKCEKCGDGYYQSDTNYYENCNTCHTCKDNEVELSPCDFKRNRVCQCKPGYFKFHLSSTRYSYECRLCKECKPGQRELKPCTADQDRVCAPRESCLKNCSRLCGYDGPTVLPTTVSKSTRHPPDPIKENLTLIAVAAAVVLIAVVAISVILVKYAALRQLWTQEKATLQSQRSEDSDSPSESVLSTESLFIRMDSGCDDNQSVPFPTHTRMEKQNSVPRSEKRDINTNQFIYSVLNLVPVSRVTELVRRLGVKDQSIDRARRDYPLSCDEAHYHMLKVWIASGPRGGGDGGVDSLSLPLLRTLLDMLRQMELRSCAETLEEEYGLEHLGHT